MIFVQFAFGRTMDKTIMMPMKCEAALIAVSA